MSSGIAGGIANGPEVDIPNAISILKGMKTIAPEGDRWEWVDKANGVFRIVGQSQLLKYEVDDSFGYSVKPC